MEENIVDWLFRQIDLDEMWAKEASRDGDNFIGTGVHWTWAAGEDWDYVDVDPTNVDFEAKILISKETFTPRHHPNWKLPQVALYADDTPALGAAGHIVNWDPARVILECRSKRLILRECLVDLDGRPGGVEGQIGTVSWYVLTGMALGYSDRPGFREDWRSE